jgi:hypothetical protein
MNAECCSIDAIFVLQSLICPFDGHAKRVIILSLFFISLQLHEIRGILEHSAPRDISSSWWGQPRSQTIFVKISGETHAEPSASVPDKFGKLQVTDLQQFPLLYRVKYFKCRTTAGAGGAADHRDEGDVRLEPCAKYRRRRWRQQKHRPGLGAWRVEVLLRAAAARRRDPRRAPPHCGAQRRRESWRMGRLVQD